MIVGVFRSLLNGIVAMAVATMMLANAAAQPAWTAADSAIVTPATPTSVETLAAKDLRRYIYEATGQWLPLATWPDAVAAHLRTPPGTFSWSLRRIRISPPNQRLCQHASSRALRPWAYQQICDQDPAARGQTMGSRDLRRRRCGRPGIDPTAFSENAGHPILSGR